MDLLSSQWRITFGETVLLDFDDTMTAEVKMPWQAVGDSVARPNADFQSQVAYGNAVNGIAFSRLLQFDDAHSARDYLLAHNAALPVVVADTMLESRGGAAYTLRGARITAVQPRIEDGCRFVCDYQLAGGKLDNGITIVIDGGGPVDTHDLDGGAPDSTYPDPPYDGGTP